MLLHVLDGTSPDPVGDYKAIQLELELFNPALLDKPQVGVYCRKHVCCVSCGARTRVRRLFARPRMPF